LPAHSDLPRVAAIAREAVALSPAHDRIQVLAGDFFEDELPPADLYSAGQILTRLERRADRAFAGPRLRPASARRFAGSRETLTESTHLLQRAGFARVEGRRTGVPLDAILAWKDA